LKTALLLLALLTPASLALAQSVSLGGLMGQKALLVIDGQTQVLAVGETARGVKLLKLQDGEALVESGGAQRALRVGGAAVGTDVGHGSSTGSGVFGNGRGRDLGRVTAWRRCAKLSSFWRWPSGGWLR